MLQLLLSPFDVNLHAASVPDTAMLGRSGLTTSSLGIGTLQWGDPHCGYGKQYDEVSTYHSKRNLLLICNLGFTAKYPAV